MATYDKIGEFILLNKEIVNEIDNIICNGCSGKEKYNCAGCTKELAMIELIVNFIEK